MKIENLKLRSAIFSSIHKYFRSHSFVEVSPPIITSMSCEIACVGGTDLISVDFYGNPVFLSQSGQLYLEALALELEKVYTISPTFRAESTMLVSHLSEFWMCEAEIVGLDFLELMKVTEDLIICIIKDILSYNESANLLNVALSQSLEAILNIGVKKITYLDALRLLKDEGYILEWGRDISPHTEKIITRYFSNAPVIIYLFPVENSSFYKAISLEDSSVTQSFDFIAPFGYREIIGASMRETNPERLIKSLLDAGQDIMDFGWYLEMIKKNQSVHGGFGLGIERLLTWICQLETITEAIPFPRTKHIIYP